MTEPLTFILVFVAVVGIAAGLFVLWLFALLAKLLFRGVFAVLGLFNPFQHTPSLTAACPRSGCRALNPTSARFCRRCGLELAQQRLPQRHAAVW